METDQKRTYIRMRNTEFAPTGPLVLGSLLTKSRGPHSFIPGSNAIPPSASDVQHREQYGWTDKYVQDHKGEYGIYTKFLEALLGGIGVDFSRGTKRKMTAKVDRLETDLFVPSEDYLQSVLSSAAVQTFLSTKRFRANLYIVTGVKTAYGSVVTDKAEKSRGLNFGVGVNGNATGVPAQGGFDLKDNSSQSIGNSHQGASDYVYAYQVKEVYYCKRKGQVIMKDVNGGALYNYEEVPADSSGIVDATKGQVEVADIAVLDRVGQEWLTAKNMRTDCELAIDDDDKECEVVECL